MRSARRSASALGAVVGLALLLSSCIQGSDIDRSLRLALKDGAEGELRTVDFDALVGGDWTALVLACDFTATKAIHKVVVSPTELTLAAPLEPSMCSGEER